MSSFIPTSSITVSIRYSTYDPASAAFALANAILYRGHDRICNVITTLFDLPIKVTDIRTMAINQKTEVKIHGIDIVPTALYSP